MPRMALVILIGLLVPVAAPAQQREPQPPYRILLIKWPEVEVRSGPSLQFPPTGILRKNAQVYVRTKSTPDGWLEIVPPPGSVSWVPKADVTKMGTATNGRQAFSITCDENSPIPIHPGGPAISDGPLPVDPQYAGKFTAKRGTQGYIRGNAVTPSWDSKMWYPIDPLPGEGRFIPAAAINDPTPDSRAIAATRPGGVAGQLTSSTPPRDTSELFRRAQAADRAGNVDEAISLYQQVARETSVNDDNRANYCATRVYELRARRGSRPGTFVSRSSDPNAGSVAPEPPLPGMNQVNRVPPAANPNPLRSTGAGFLRRTGFSIDNRPTYALIDQGRRVIYYVTPEPGISLEQYVDRWVDLHGIIEIRGDVRGADYMRVVKIYLLR